MGCGSSTSGNSNQQFYKVNCCDLDGSVYLGKSFSQSDAQQYHPYLSVFMKMLSEKLNEDYYLNFAHNKSIEKFPHLDPEMQDIAGQLGRALGKLLSKIDENRTEKIYDPNFGAILSQLLMVSLTENAKDVTEKSKADLIFPPVNPKEIPPFCEPKDYFFLDSCKLASQLLPTPYDRLKEMKPFILDNSIRESTVAQQRGHVKSDKYAILETVESTGIQEFIVGSFGELPRVEDEWLQEMKDLKKMKPNFWAFTELRDEVIDGRPSADIPLGLRKIMNFGIPNVIIELDVMCNQTDWCEYATPNGKWNNQHHCELMQSRILTIKNSISPNSRVVFNFRDAVKAFNKMETARRLLEFTVFLAKLPLSLRPLGVLFEEPAGDTFPWQIRDVCRLIKKAMEDNNWPDGELLIHCHKNYGMCEAVIEEALAHGCTGIWCGISEEGAGTGAGCSLLTLTNLARYGNKHITQMVNFPRMYHAAKEICLITTGQEPHPKTELYGSRAMDILWNQSIMPVSEFDLHLFFDVPSTIRITTFTTPEMFRQQLANTFGNHPEDWEFEIAESMRRQLHEDLLSEDKFDYQTPTGLYDLYVRAGGKKYLREMIETVLQHTKNQSKKKSFSSSAVMDGGADIAEDHPLLVQLKHLYDLYASKDGRMTYKNFFYCFINRFISCFNFPCPKFNAVVQAIDVDQSGDIDWPEISVWAKWAIEEYKLTAENCDIDRLTHMVFVGHIFPVAFQNLYKVKSKSKKYVAEIMYLGDEDSKLHSFYLKK
jgi:hypothetical protein